MKKRFLSILLVLIMLISVFPTTALAEGTGVEVISKIRINGLPRPAVNDPAGNITYTFTPSASGRFGVSAKWVTDSGDFSGVA